MNEILASQLSRGMVAESTTGRRKIHELWRYDPCPGSDTFGRASRGTIWVVWDDGKGRKGTTTVYDEGEHVTVRA